MSSPGHLVRRMRRTGWLGRVFALVVLALVGQGFMVGLLLQLGPLHVHRAMPRAVGASVGSPFGSPVGTSVGASLASMAGWEDFRRVHEAGPAPQVHEHRALERHRHAAGDPTVVAVDGDGDEAAGAGWTLAALTPGLLPRALPAFAGDPARDWPTLRSIRFASRCPPLPDRPPKG